MMTANTTVILVHHINQPAADFVHNVLFFFGFQVVTTNGMDIYNVSTTRESGRQHDTSTGTRTDCNVPSTFTVYTSGVEHCAVAGSHMAGSRNRRPATPTAL